VSEFTTHMTTHGLGRYLIDLPPTWRFGSGDVTLYYGLGTDFKTVDVEVIDQGVTPAQFHAAVAWRAQRIQDVTNHETHRSMLVGSWPVDVRIDDGKGGKGREGILLRFFRSTLGGGSQAHELHMLLGNTYVQLTAKSYEGVPGAGPVETRDQVEARLRTLARQIFLIRDPARERPGFILGPIIIDGPQDHERATINFYDPNRLDVTLEVESMAVTPDESPRLLNRIDRDFAASDTPVHVLRRGKHDFAGMAGEEVLFTMEEQANQSKTTIHSFTFVGESYRPDPGLPRPSFALRLSAGGDIYWDSDKERLARQAAPDYLMNESRLPSFAAHDPSPSGILDPPPVDASLTDNEATAVWDAILPTIRPRPGAVALPKPRDEPPPPISRDQAQRDQQALDAFIASRPD